MGILKDKVDLSLLVYGNGVAENFKANSLFFYEKYQKSDKEVTSININDIKVGGFYFLHYLDDSNWMRLSPIFVADYRKFSNMIVLMGINFNFIPLEVRVSIFDKFIIEDDFEKDSLLKVDYKGVYSELLKFGFEYALMEYNLIQVKLVHKISMDMIPRFLYSQHPQNKYDPNKLMQIWNAKIGERDDRHKEMMTSLLSDFYEVDGDIKDKYKMLKDHIQRIQKSLQKYGGK
jgi:hypothetical protein